MTGLSKPTVNALVQDLEKTGIVRRISSTQSHGRIGRPAASYELIADAAVVVGVDMGATKTLVGVANLLGEVIAMEQIETPSSCACRLGRRGDHRWPAAGGLWWTGRPS